MATTNNEVIRSWANTVIQNGTPGHMWGGSVQALKDGVLRYQRFGGPRSRSWGPVDLARWLPKTRTILLNGDGFTDEFATSWQTRTRNRIHQLHWRNRDKSRVKHIVVIPYQALIAAGIEFDSIRPIDVVSDETIQIWHRVNYDGNYVSRAVANTSGDRRTFEFSVDGNVFRVTESRKFGYTSTATNEWFENMYDARGATGSSSGITHGYEQGTWNHVSVSTLIRVQRDPNTTEVGATNSQWAQLDHLHGEVRRRVASQFTQQQEWAAGQGSRMLLGEPPTEDGWYWTDTIHHLGSTLFSAVDASGRRHKFVSAFDVDEPNRMYFLAQLPDGSGATTYEQALLALAPPIVHKARLEKRSVLRQGDVFAIETNLTTEEVYAKAKTRVRRDVVLYSMNPSRMLRVMQGTEHEPAWQPGEVTEKVPCICGCGHKRTIPYGEKARRALVIYGTGHTADEVVTTAKGVTFIRGALHHDPGILEPGRRPEHQDVILSGEFGGRWFIAVRNTVPRRKAVRRIAEQNIEEEVTAGA